MENTDNLFHLLLENTRKQMQEETIPAGQPGGPSITPDESDLTAPSPSQQGSIMPPSNPAAPQGNQRPDRPSRPDQPGRPRPDHGFGGGYGQPQYPMGPGPVYVPYPAIPYYGTNPYDYRDRGRVSRREKMVDPESCDSFDEQIEVIANNLRLSIVSGRMKQAAKIVDDWYDGIVDDDDRLFPETKAMLSNLSKNSLVAFIEALVASLQ